jgi:integrase
VRVTAAGVKAFVLNYRNRTGRERRLTIGRHPDWTAAQARERARELRREIDGGGDPLAERIAEREAPTVNELADRYLVEHAPKKRTAIGDRRMLDRYIRPRLGARKVTDVVFADVDRLHREISKTAPYVANRVAALLSKMFALAIRWEMRADNPVKGVERNREERRYRYLAGEELHRLSEALASHPSPAAANAIRLLLLTGARRMEVLAARWDQFDLAAGIWTKPSSHTKQKREHRVPLSAPALQLLVAVKAAAAKDAPYVFPARPGGAHMRDLHRSWGSLCRAARIEGVRVHDLRHTYASVLASAGLSLPIIGGLLGHSNPATTARYSHLFDDPLRAATDRAAAIIGGREKAEIVALHVRG